MKRLKLDKRGISNVIVVMLSLVLIVIVVANVVLWSYQMNQFDLERTQETVRIANVTQVTRSSWLTAQSEYALAAGRVLSGTYIDTRTIDSSYERFREEKTQLFNPSNYAFGNLTKYVSGNIDDLKSDDGSYITFRSYPNYEIRYQESLSVSSTTSTSYQDKVSMVFTPQITADFVIIATAEVQGSSTSYQVRAQLAVNSTTYQELRYRVKDTTDWYPFDGVKRLTLSEGITYIFKIQFSTNNGGATAFIRNAKLLLLSLQSEYAESEVLSTTSSTSWQDKVALTFTPTSDGDYLIIVTANYRGSSTSRDVDIRVIQDDTTVHIDTMGRPGSGTTANYYTFGVMRKVTLSAASHSFKIQYCSSDSLGTAGINYAHIVAIRISQFASSNYAESEIESVPALANTWYDKVVSMYTAVESDYLLMGSVAYKSGSTSYSVGLDFQTDSTSRQLPLAEHRDPTTYESTFFMTVQTLTSGNKTDKIRWMGESTSARVRNARLISIQLPATTQTAEVEFSGNSNTQGWTRLEWTADSSFTTTGVATTFQLYNYQTGRYPSSGDGYMSDTINSIDVTKNQTITINPTDYRDAAGNWKIKIKGVKATTTQFEFKADWVEFKATASNNYQLNINNNFAIDLSSYPLSYLRGIEIFVKYNVSEVNEKWFIKAYNWTASSFTDSSFNNTGGNQPVLNEWNSYAINVTADWLDYVRGDGVVLVKFLDEGLDTNQTVVDVDFFGVRAIFDGASFSLSNSGPTTVHVVAIWIINSTSHQRYSANLFINSGTQATYNRVDVLLPKTSFIAKIVTERGNIAVFSAT
jgi:hypothetical protein